MGPRRATLLLDAETFDPIRRRFASTPSPDRKEEVSLSRSRKEAELGGPFGAVIVWGGIVPAEG